MRFTDFKGPGLLLIAAASAMAQTRSNQDLTQISLEDLMNVQVTSVSKKEQRLSKAGAAVYVITQEDIRRSGMTNIPDILRMAPGVNVARITANTWAISVRGFNDRYSKKVLVLIDGRSIYTQEFSGVLWDQQSVPIEDIDRIEVIRGPGGTVWGANAVNGVINIITKDSLNTQGGLVTAGTGTDDTAQGLVRFGGKAGRKGSYRVFGKYFNVENAVYPNGRGASDGWDALQAGFRSDWTLSSKDTVTVAGDVYKSREGQNLTAVLPGEAFQTRTFDDRIKVNNSNIQGRWTHTFANGSETAFQVFNSDATRFDKANDNLDTLDLDLQYRFQVGERHDLVSGASYRNTSLQYEGLYNYRYDRPHLVSQLFSTFLQDEIGLSKTLTLTVGSKFEHSSFTGFEFEPSAQIVWTPNARKTLWFSAARAIRQPSWFDEDSELESAAFPLAKGGFGVFQQRGNHNMKAEQLFDFEAGYRTQIRRGLSLDVTAFQSFYRRLATVEVGVPYFTLNPGPPHLVLPATPGNLGQGKNYGVEAVATWQISSRWRMAPGFSLLHMNLSTEPASTGAGIEAYAGNSPKHQAQLRSSVNLGRRLEWDASGYYVGALNGILGTIPNRTPGYVRLDSRIGWRFSESVELSITGQNLLSSRHSEFVNAYQVSATQVQRSVFGKLTWRF